jgi:SAM-dependent methyltransferase
VDAVVGKTLPHADCNPFDRRGLRRRFGAAPRFLTDGAPPGFSNANSAVRRAAWREEPFDETLPFSEDVRWARRRLGRGRSIVYAPDAAVHHSHNESAAQLRQRFRAEARAREIIDPRGPRYRLLALLVDLIGGTLFDWWTVLRRRAGGRWALFAPRRRWAINVGRWLGSRGLALERDRSPWPVMLDRLWLRARRFAGGLAGRLAPRVVQLTRKHPRPIHPKHLLTERRDHFWYADHLRGGTHALDVGCNVGAHANFVAQQGLAVIGFDIDPVALGHARFLLRWERAPKALVARASAERAFPVGDQSVDRVLALDVIEHLSDPAHLLNEVYRVLADDGLLLLTAPNADTSWKRRLRRAGLPSFADPGHRVEYTRAGIEADLRAAGFALVDSSPIVADTSWAPWYDLAGAFSLKLYEKLADRKRARALREPAESTGFRLVARKVRT